MLNNSEKKEKNPKMEEIPRKMKVSIQYLTMFRRNKVEFHVEKFREKKSKKWKKF